MNEITRKIFDLLGVEPNEEFNIKDMNGPWKIDEKLNIYYRQGHNNHGDYVYNHFNNSLIIELIKGNECIIKLPKKKKLRDLTKNEVINFCEKNDKSCPNCLFYYVHCSTFDRKCWIYHKELYSDKFLDQEIEVE